MSAAERICVALDFPTREETLAMARRLGKRAGWLKVGLEAFTAERAEMGLAEVARAANIDNATAFRFLNTLVQLGYVEKIPEAKRFRLTLKCIDLGFNAIARTDLREFARPLLRELLNDTIEAASIAVPDGPDLVYVERVQAGLVRLGVDVRIGSRVPAYSTAIGQAVLYRHFLRTASSDGFHSSRSVMASRLRNRT